MAGEAKTQSFMLGTATVMIGEQSALFDLTPTANSIGLVKQFTMTSEPAYTELTQGVKNSLVYSTMTGNPTRATMEVYEYTSQNLAYALGIGGSFATITGSYGIASAITGTSGSPATSVVLATGAGTNFAVGDWIMIQEGADDRVTTRRVTAKSTDTLTITPGIKRSIATSGTTVRKVNSIGVGSKEDQPFFSAMIVGTLANGDEMSIAIPKLRITRGFTMAFTTDDYGNLPFEFQLYDQVSTDPFFAEFEGMQAKVFSFQ